MTDSSNEMTPEEKIIQERVNQSRKFLNSNGFNLSLKELWNEIKEDSKFDLLYYYKFPQSVIADYHELM